MIKIQRQNSDCGGYALVIVTAMTAVIASVLAACLSYVATEQRLTRDSATRTQALHAAEAGVELAVDAFNSHITGGSGWAGWAHNGDTYVQTVTTLLTGQNGLGCELMVTANTNTLAVTATCTIFSEFLDRSIVRTVQVALDPDVCYPYQFGVLGKSHVKLVGNSFMNSFDSTDPTKSTGGMYDASKAQGNLTIATMSSDPSSAIHGAGNGTVRGDLKTAAGGGLQNGGNFVYTGSLSDNLNVTIPDVTVPWTLSPPFSTSLTVDKDNPQTIVTAGDTDLEFDSVTVGNKAMLTLKGSGRVRIYVDDAMDVVTGGLIEIDNSSTSLQIEIYLNGNAHFNGFVLGSGFAKDLAIMGTPNCTDIKYTGQSDFVGMVYAPQASFHLTGQGGMVGAVTADFVNMTGQGDFHYDESLGRLTLGSGGVYEVISWMEL